MCLSLYQLLLLTDGLLTQSIFARTKIKVRSFNCRGYFVQKAKLARKHKLDYYLSAAQPFF